MSDNWAAELDKTSWGSLHCHPSPPTVVWGTLHSTAVICQIHCGKVQVLILFCFKFYLTAIMIYVYWTMDIFSFALQSSFSSLKWLIGYPFLTDLDLFCPLIEFLNFQWIGICFCTCVIYESRRAVTWEYPNRLVRCEKTFQQRNNFWGTHQFLTLSGRWHTMNICASHSTLNPFIFLYYTVG